LSLNKRGEFLPFALCNHLAKYLAICSLLDPQPRNRRPAYIVAAGQFVERRALRAPPDGLFLLRRRQRRGPAHLLSLGLGAAPALGGAGADQIALHVGQAAENREHQAPGAAGPVGPRFRQGSKLRPGVHDAFDDGEQVEGAACEPVDPRHGHTSPGVSLPSIRLSSRRSARAPVTFSR
jgi:hypothetical protein